MKKLFILSLLLGFTFNVMAQTNHTSDLAFKAKAKQDAEEVYKGYPQYTTPENMEVYEAFLARVEIKQQPITPNETYQVLSSVVMKNKYNNDLVRENGSNFNPVTFNPLKYFFEINAKQEKVYRVDNAPYLIVIHAQQ